MPFSPADIQEFMNIFKGAENAFGQFEPGAVSAQGEKQTGKSYTEKKILTFPNYQSHIDGKIGLGVIPIHGNDVVNFCVIDVDTYSLEKVSTILDLIFEYNLPLLPFKSKSGGLHIYIFFELPTPAKEAIEIMKQFLIIFKLEKKTEIFPKQASISSSSNARLGNWINLPYFNANDTTRYLITEPTAQTRVDLFSAIQIIRQNKQTISKLKNVLNTLPFADGPPCLQNIFMHKDLEKGGGRNNYLFSVGRYYKSKDESALEDGIIEANERFADPGPLKEIQNLIHSVKKTEATYLCAQEPLKSLCRRTDCQLREFGIDHGSVSNFSFGQLTKFESQTPYYIWKIDDQDFEFFSEEEILNQTTFQQKCLRLLHKAPKILKPHIWLKIINTAFENIKVEKIAIEDDLSPKSKFFQLFGEFLKVRSLNTSLKEMHEHKRVFKDAKHFYFKPDSLYEHLTDVKNFRLFNMAQVSNMIRKLHGEPWRPYDEETKRTYRCWRIPIEKIASFVADDTPEIDFTKELEERSDF